MSTPQSWLQRKSPVGSRLSLKSSLGLSHEWLVGHPTVAFLKAALRPGVLRGAACPDVLKGSGARVSLPVAHYSDKDDVAGPSNNNNNNNNKD